MRTFLSGLAAICAVSYFIRFTGSMPFDEAANSVTIDANTQASDCGCGSQFLSRNPLVSFPNLNLPKTLPTDNASYSSDMLKKSCTGAPEIDIGEDMVLIPGGTFVMGLKKPEIPTDGESPQRHVRVSSFFMDKYEVSNAQYEIFVKATGYRTESEKFRWSFVFESAVPNKSKRKITQAVLGAEWWLPVNGSYWKEPEGPGTDVFNTNRSNYPVVQVSWNDADAFCAWRGSKQGNRSRLPTEAEWEYAAQGTGVGKSAIFPWGKSLTPGNKHVANVYQGIFPYHSKPTDGYEFLAPVDAYGPQNEYGLHNIIGNAWEWVLDWFTVAHPEGSSPQSPLINPRGPETGREKVKKGGSFLCHASYCYRYRTAARYYSTPDSATLNTGFRCAKSVVGEAV